MNEVQVKILRKCMESLEGIQAEVSKTSKEEVELALRNFSEIEISDALASATECIGDALELLHGVLE